MLIRVPDYYDRFRCLAGDCPHTCCEKWEVVIDPDTAARYRQVPGPLGDRLRAALETDGDGDLCFPLNGGRCPFLDGKDLCEIHRQLGEEATSVTCREHPRFTEDYGPFREITLSASCPAANALLLGGEAPLTFREFETAEPGEPGDPWLPGLLALRRRLLELLTDRARPLRIRQTDFLRLAAAAQDLLDEDRAEDLPGLASAWREGEADTVELSGLGVLKGLEALEKDWPALLDRAEMAASTPISENALERIAVYFAFRYLLKTVNDGDLMSRARLCVFTPLAVERLASVCGLWEALRRFSCEVEHSDENLEALLKALRSGEGLLA